MIRSGNIYINRTITMKIYFTIHLSSRACVRACDLAHRLQAICMHTFWVRARVRVHVFNVPLLSQLLLFLMNLISSPIRNPSGFFRVHFKFLLHPDYLCPPSMESIDANRQDLIGLSIWPVFKDFSVYTHAGAGHTSFTQDFFC